MKFGYFDDEAREYVITTPRTPLPWINYLGSQDFFSLISNTGGGYSFYKDAKLLRITRYRYNDIPNDSNGKYYYINDNGTVWNPGFMPSRTELDSYECRHGMGYTRFKSGFFTVNTSVDGFDTSRDDFLGAYNSNAIPDAVRECKCHNSIASGWYPAAVHQINLWLIAAVAAYLKETGDASILDAQVPFDCKPGTEEPLFEHLRRSFQYTADHLGPHKLPLIGRADWNDCLNLNCFSSEPGESFQTTGPSEGPVAESVFIAGMFVKYGDEFAKISKLYGNTELSEKAEKEVKNMYQAILGICPDYEGLRIDPCIPEGFGDFTITRIFRDAVYHIQIQNPSNVQKGVTHLNVDGKEIDGNMIPYETDKKEYFVTAYMG